MVDGVPGLGEDGWNLVARVLRRGKVDAGHEGRDADVAGFGLEAGAGLFQPARQFAPQIAGGNESLLGGAVIAALLASFGLALWLSRTASRPAQ